MRTALDTESSPRINTTLTLYQGERIDGTIPTDLRSLALTWYTVHEVLNPAVQIRYSIRKLEFVNRIGQNRSRV